MAIHILGQVERIGFDNELATGIVRFVARWFVPLLAGASIGAGAGGLISLATPPQYRATAQLYVASSSSSPLQDVTLGQNLARNYVPLVTAERVLRAAMDRLRFGYDLDRFRSRTSVAQVKDTAVITVSFADQDPSRAASAANAIIQAFADQSSSLQATLYDAAASRLEEQSRVIAADIRLLDAQIAAVPATASAAPGQANAPGEQQARVRALESLRQSKQQTLEELVRSGDGIRLNAARSGNTVNVWQEAMPPTRADSPNPVLTTTLGAIGGAPWLLLLFVQRAAESRPPLDDQRELGEAVEGSVLARLHGRHGPRAAAVVGRLDPDEKGPHGLPCHGRSVGARRERAVNPASIRRARRK